MRKMHLDRIISILETISTSGRAISSTEIQAATGLPRPTCYRLLQTLLDYRLINDADGNSKYTIGSRLVGIALSGTSDKDVRHASSPLMKTAALRLNETVFLGRLRNKLVEIIHVETPEDPGRAYVHPGIGLRPLHACSCSRAIAAFADSSFQESILNGQMEEFTAYTKTTPDALRAEFDQIVEQGFAECDQEIDLGVSSVAAPITVGNIGAIFAVGSVGPVRRFDPDTRMSIGENLKQLSERLSGAIQICNVTAA